MPHSIFKRAGVKVALAGVSCDIPVVRKVCGYPGHNATLGCSNASRVFDHQKLVVKYHLTTQNSTDKNGQHVIFRLTKLMLLSTSWPRVKNNRGSQNFGEYVTRYYLKFHTLIRIKFHVVDPMHNLQLGTANHVMETWTNHGILTTNKI